MLTFGAQRVDGQNAMFLEIRDIIVEDNERCGTKPASAVPSGRSSLPGNVYRSIATPSSTPRPLSMPDSPVTTRGDLVELSFDQGVNYASSQLDANHSAVRPGSQHLVKPTRDRPTVRPKPNGLQAQERYAERRPSDLEQRFSQLRVQRKISPAPTNPESHDTSIINKVVTSTLQQLKTSSPGVPNAGSFARSEPSTATSSSRPSGPREMHVSHAVPPHPPKLPLDPESTASFPRAPSPAYDPARAGSFSVQSPPSADKRPVLSLADPMPTVSRYPADNADVDAMDQIASTNGMGQAPGRNRFIEAASTRAITTTQFKNHLRSSNVLVIDVRNRQDYDQGHVLATSVICIEPVGLKLGMSADELEDRLVVSPLAEQSLFERRNEFDLVVYYDQETSSDRFLDGPPVDNFAVALRAMHDCLYEFNVDKPLRRRPVLLLGGLEAWMDLMTPQSLAVTQTAVQVGLARDRKANTQPGRPIGRVRMASANSSSEVRRRRLQGHLPLNAAEEKTWRETARTEGIESVDYPGAQSDSDTDSTTSQSQGPPSPFVHSYNEFLRKFPEYPGLQQSMTTVSRPPLPPIATRIPSTAPSVPSRPPPAVPRPSYSGVSERESSQHSPASRQLLSEQPPLYTGRALSDHRRLPRTGLVNFGVTCYMNATIQCLMATLELSNLFLNERWRDLTQKNWKGSHGIMPEIYANLMYDLWRGGKKSIRPGSFRKFCARLNGEWGVERQQDAKEFFDFIIDCLHEDLNSNWQRSQLQPLTKDQELRRETMPAQEVSSIEWGRYEHREKSRISDMFAGQHASKLRCTTCKHTSTTHEAFYSVSVEIPQSGKGDIHECLRSYCKEEKLGRDELWKCPYCKCEREATKQITITRAPRILVVHFKRFSASKHETARKIHTPIHFPLHQLNIGPYMLQSPAASNRERIAIAEDGDPATTPPFIYDCYAVMRHLGTSLSGGHYIALVRDEARGCWRKFDDEYSSDFDPARLRPEQRLQNEQAYLVFYNRAAAR